MDGNVRYKTAHGIQLHVKNGDITTLNVDVVLNPTDRTLSNNMGVSKAISDAAGDRLGQECKSIIRQRQWIDN